MEKRDEILTYLNYTVQTTDLIINENLIGAVSAEHGKHHLYRIAVILYNDNDGAQITRKEITEIAQTVDILITDCGIDLHSYSLKTDKTFENFKILKPAQWTEILKYQNDKREVGNINPDKYIKVYLDERKFQNGLIAYTSTFAEISEDTYNEVVKMYHHINASALPNKNYLIRIGKTAKYKIDGSLVHEFSYNEDGFLETTKVVVDGFTNEKKYHPNGTKTVSY